LDWFVVVSGLQKGAKDARGNEGESGGVSEDQKSMSEDFVQSPQTSSVRQEPKGSGENPGEMPPESWMRAAKDYLASDDKEVVQSPESSQNWENPGEMPPESWMRAAEDYLASDNKEMVWGSKSSQKCQPPPNTQKK